ncbi:MAG: preprotein translocase subunit SecG [Limisphaerales bacterium]
MEIILAGLLTALLVMNCVLLIFLVLIQLPKKDAGAGLAFGSGAADALFGAGSGNALTKVTKYSTCAFFALALVLGIFEQKMNSSNSSEFEKGVQQKQSALPAALPPVTTPTGAEPSTAPATPAADTNGSLALPLSVGTNASPN